jgi:hypothetical protein
MIFIFHGYHHQKYVQREEEARKKEELKENSQNGDGSN